MVSGDEDYRRAGRSGGSGSLSPWLVVDGWHLESCFHDPMHVLYLGVCKDLFPSVLSIWMRRTNLGGGGNLAEKLRVISDDLKRECRKQRFLSTMY